MIYIFFLIIISVHSLILSNIQFTAWPEMFSYPYLLNNGFKMYKDIGFPYQPILPLILEFVFRIFGFKLLSLQIFTWLIILINDCLIFLISLKLTGKKILSVIPLAIYVLIQPLAEGNMLWFDLATTPFILLGVYLLLKLKSTINYFLFGLMFSIAFFIKQQTGILYLLLISYLILSKNFREMFYILAGSILPAIFVLFYVIFNGIISDYIFWTIEVPVLWYPKFPGYTDLPSIKEALFVGILFIPVVYSGFKLLGKDTNFTVVFFLFTGAFIAAFPRFAFFRFQPALALYVVLLMYIIPVLKIRFRLIFYSIAILVFGLLLKNNLQFFYLPARFYGDSEYKTSQNMGNFVSHGQTLYLLNEHSLFYILTSTIPPKPWIDNYVWYMEIEGMQTKVIDGLNKNPPKIIFRKNPIAGNWYNLGAYEPKKIVEYIEQNYQKTAIIESEIEVWKRN
ncbi:hypothetical protein A3F00_02965 [Candidatus Daviesbacteria bacterium RIFCSPHIGHO2_12_FULL_37_11]|uniref:Glycosyltransferase RgtA/B/C/D-like domain-containing protein n=1 Tax=Candidatus Daviesbacteria bacterium RIFCSPHIGHO2_12_FULL_37_11 TaxID=1797777 RepID=A0A1F5KCB1_9BACT|nr:MAG: hypothetical protein A3F00_02965 [Candidatus Daviesbacteria bacterium RIFCSPHIGHO2_12_FULL_37_11]